MARASLGRLNPDYPEALCTLGLAIQASGRPGDAVDHFRRALELRPNFAQAHRNLATVLRELGQHDEALEHLRTAIELAPRYPAARSGLTLVFLDRDQAEEAFIHSQEAVRLQPDLAIHHHNSGNVLERFGAGWLIQGHPGPDMETERPQQWRASLPIHDHSSRWCIGSYTTANLNVQP